MKKEKSIQADIEVLRGLRNTPYPRPKQQDAIDRAISWGEAMRDASDMLPEKKELENFEDNSKRDIKRSFNQAIDLCTPILAKALEENKALRDRLDDWIYELAYYTEDEVATPVGVKKFVGKALEDKVKEIKELENA